MREGVSGGGGGYAAVCWQQQQEAGDRWAERRDRVEFPASRMGFVSRGLVLPRTMP